MATRVRVVIDGTSFTVEADGLPEAEVRKRAAYVDSVIADLRKSRPEADGRAVAVCAAITIAGEYLDSARDRCSTVTDGDTSGGQREKAPIADAEPKAG